MLNDVSTGTICVPKKGSRLDQMIDPGSGIVGRTYIDHEGQKYIVIWYEGNRYNAINLHQIEERVACAAGRMFTRYPTAAMQVVMRGEEEDLVPVGSVEWEGPYQPIKVIWSDKPDDIVVLNAYCARYRERLE